MVEHFKTTFELLGKLSSWMIPTKGPNIQSFAYLPRGCDEIAAGSFSTVHTTAENPYCVSKVLKIRVNEDYVTRWPGEYTESGDKLVTISDLEAILERDDLSKLLNHEMPLKPDFVVGEANPNELTVVEEVLCQHLSVDEHTKERIVPLLGLWFIKDKDGAYHMEIIFGRMNGSLEDMLNPVLDENGQYDPLERMLPIDHSLYYVSELKYIAAVLDRANEKGIVHRDIKPANLLIDSKGRVRLADFNTSITATAGLEIGGTLKYMSPESIVSGLLTGKADQYSLAITLAEMLLGRDITTYLTRDLTDVREAVRSIVNNDLCFNDLFFETLRREFAHCDVDLLEFVFKKATSKDQDDRFSSNASMVYIANLALSRRKVQVDRIVEEISKRDHVSNEISMADSSTIDDLFEQQLQIGMDQLNELAGGSKGNKVSNLWDEIRELGIDLTDFRKDLKEALVPQVFIVDTSSHVA
jgi:serine/threonine protein kinase